MVYYDCLIICIRRLSAEYELRRFRIVVYSQAIAYYDWPRNTPKAY